MRHAAELARRIAFLFTDHNLALYAPRSYHRHYTLGIAVHLLAWFGFDNRWAQTCWTAIRRRLMCKTWAFPTHVVGEGAEHTLVYDFESEQEPDMQVNAFCRQRLQH